MSYRDDHDALRGYHDTLERELASLDTRSAELSTVTAERARVAGELARVRRDLDHMVARRGPIRLDNLRVASPCKESWDRMTGDDRARACARCDKQVFDLSAMTTAEAEDFLASRGVTACVRFYRRTDGTVMTSDCPEGVARRRTMLALATAGGLAAAAGVAAVTATMGKPAKLDPRESTELVPMPPLPEPPTVSIANDREATMGVVAMPAPPPSADVDRRSTGTIPLGTLARLRTSGETQVQPSDATRAAMKRAGAARVLAVIKLCVDPRGAVADARLLKPSGYPDYDERLLTAVRAWTHQPYVVDGEAVSACSAVTFVYQVE